MKIREIIVESRRLFEGRIVHPEDMIIDGGIQGAQQAVAGLAAIAKGQEPTTIKWDGSPAVIFGRKPTGEFVLTDKAGATAVGYDGMATSPQQLAQIMQYRDQQAASKGKETNRSELSQMYQEIWPYFEAAVPKNFRGYLKGDMLFYPQRPWVEDAGNLVFQPNQFGGIPYRIPVDSPLGKQIANSQVGEIGRAHV